MISRRNIRVKVMQSVYAAEALNDKETNALTKEEILSKAMKHLQNEISQASDLLAFNMLYMAKIAQYAEADARNRSSKYLPTVEDMNVNTKIAGNIFLWELLDNVSFQEKVKSDKLESKLDAEWVKKMYQSLVQSEAYQQYVATRERSKSDDKKMMQYIWHHTMLENEAFQEYLSDEWTNWDDDKEMVMMLIGNYFKNNKQTNFLKFISAEKKEYAEQLLTTVIDKEDYCMELIAPKLKNWDAERVASIDIILLRMGVCEFLYFPTIPTKVTINEYIDIAKNYSTPQSGQFINGVLDNLLKDLLQQNKIRKVDRR